MKRTKINIFKNHLGKISGKIKLLFWISIFVFIFSAWEKTSFFPNQVAAENATQNQEILSDKSYIGDLANDNSAEAWRQDLHFFVDQLSKVHPHPFHNISRTQFAAAVKSLDARIPSLSREQIIVELQRIVTLLGEGHSQMGLTWDEKIGFRQYPLRLYLYHDGLFVRLAAPELADTVGKKVIRIGKFSAVEAMKRVRPIIQHDNEMTIRDDLPSRLMIPEVLHALGITDDEENTPITLADESGNQTVVNLTPRARKATIKWIHANEKSSNPVPLYLKNFTDNYWFEYLKDSNTIYVQFNSVLNKENETIEEFFKKVFAFAAANPVSKFVIDIRFNNGGDNTLIKPIIDGIVNSDKINRKGRLFTIIGRLTFSAAQNFANAMEKNTKTIFVGEPTGGKPNHYGDAKNIILPNSQISVRISTLYWQDMPSTDHRPWIAPQIRADLTSDEYRDNKDPAMQAILAYQVDKY